MARIYTTDKKILCDDFPQIQIGDKLFKVDTRKSTYDKLQKAVEAAPDDQADRVVMEFLLGKEQTKEIDKMGLTVSGTLHLMTYLQAALYDISFEEAEARFRKAQQE